SVPESTRPTKTPPPLGLHLAFPPLDAEVLRRRHEQIHIVPRLAPAHASDIGAAFDRADTFKYRLQLRVRIQPAGPEPADLESRQTHGAPLETATAPCQTMSEGHRGSYS